MTSPQANSCSNLPMLELFARELKEKSAAMENLLGGLKKNEDSKLILETLRKTLYEIKGSSKIVKLQAIAEVCAILENYVKYLLENSKSIPEEFQKDLHFLLQEFQNVSHEDPKFLDELLGSKANSWLDLLRKWSKFPTMVVDADRAIEARNTCETEKVIDPSMFELFKAELENQSKLLSNELMAIEISQDPKNNLETLMRAAHSIKGASRVIKMDLMIDLAHAMEDYFVAAQNHKVKIEEQHIDEMLQCVDLLREMSEISVSNVFLWLEKKKNKILELTQVVKRASSGESALPKLEQEIETTPASLYETITRSDRVLRVTAKNLNRLMGLAGESLVESRWLQPFSDHLTKQKKMIDQMIRTIELLRESFEGTRRSDTEEHYLSSLQEESNLARNELNDRLAELELFISRHSSLSDRLYHEVIDSRMRPFADGVESFPRMVRDLARQLHKKVRLEIKGKNTPVDRDILEKLEAPLAHLIRNAVDHGIETPEERIAAGKPAEGLIEIEAIHRSGMLAIIVSDDGRGLQPEEIRKKILEKKMAKPEMVAKFSDHELVDFLFLPGFTTSANVTDISGRGVGLNVVQNMVQEVAGSIRTTFNPGHGMTYSLSLPLTLSVIRALIVVISGEIYAFPLARIERALQVSPQQIKIIENAQFFFFEGDNIGLIPASQIIDRGNLTTNSQSSLSVIVLTDRNSFYGVVVDGFLGEKELVVLEMDSRLGKIPNISAGAFMEDGSPVLIVDVEDLVRSIDHILSGGKLQKLTMNEQIVEEALKKRILVVDDSATVREVESRLLKNQGFEVETAVNGVDGWNAIRIGNYQLVITDIDMPRMNGIDLVKRIRADSRFRDLPILVVSYKEREEDKNLALEAGANFYLTKSSFNDETMIRRVSELIGMP